jgi:hypothetical protein
MFVGYDEDRSAYRIYRGGNRFETCRIVKFLPASFTFHRKTTVERPIIERMITSFHEYVDELTDSEEDDNDNDSTSDYNDESDQSESEYSNASDDTEVDLSRTDDQSDDDYDINTMAAALTMLYEDDEPDADKSRSKQQDPQIVNPPNQQNVNQQNLPTDDNDNDQPTARQTNKGKGKAKSKSKAKASSKTATPSTQGSSSSNNHIQPATPTRQHRPPPWSPKAPSKKRSTQDIQPTDRILRSKSTLRAFHFQLTV